MGSEGDQPTVSVKLKVGTSSSQLASDMAATMKGAASTATAGASGGAVPGGSSLAGMFAPAVAGTTGVADAGTKATGIFGGLNLKVANVASSIRDAHKAGDAWADATAKKVSGAFDQAGSSIKGAIPFASKLGAAGMFAIGGLAIGATAAVGAIAAGVYAAESRMESLKATTTEMLALAPGKNFSLNQAKIAADAYDQTFRRIAIGAGQTRADVAEAFKAVSHGLPPGYGYGGTAGGMYGGAVGPKRKSGAQAEAVVQDMAQASRLVPGGLGALTKEYEEMKSGKFASNGALVTMVTTTGLLKGNAFEVANQMARMSDAKRIETAEAAMKKMAQTAKDMPMSMGEMANSLKEVADLGLTSLGEPFVQQLMPLLTDVKGWFVNNASAIEMTASKVGSYIGGFVNGVGKIIGTFYSVFSSDSSKLGTYVQKAFDYAKDAFSWIVDNAEPLAKTFKDIFDVIITAIEKAVESAKKVYEYFNAPKAGEGADDKGMTADETRSYLTNVMKDIKGGKVSAEERTSSSGQVSSDLSWTMKRANAILDSGTLSTTEAAAFRKELEQLQAGFRGIKDAAAAVPKEGPVSAEAAQALVNAYNQASLQHNEGNRRYIMSLLNGNVELQTAFIKFGGDVQGGLKKLAMDMNNTHFLDLVRDASKASLDKGKPLAPVVQFNGNTFNIKQDFRDQDPDRVMLVFKRDILESAKSRGQGTGALPFGQ